MKYIISIDQSTQGTKALLFDINGNIVKRMDKSHKQLVDDNGWVSHDPIEIYENVLTCVECLLSETKVNSKDILGIGISNQRETSVAWCKKTGEPLGHAIVWQCARAKDICENVEQQGKAEMIREKTGMKLSPYFPASKIAWLIRNIEGAKEKADKKGICHGTIDSWLIYKLTRGRSYKTDYSNASRTQLFNIFELKWDEEICDLFGIDIGNLPEVCDSNANFGETEFEGLLEEKVPIHSVLGDSHGALYGQGCLKKGMTKATYGTGSSIMMNIGENPILSKHGVVTSLAWSIDGKVNYVLEGNLNYTGAVITWLKDDMKIIQSPQETETLAKNAQQNDSVYLIPAFSGLGAPYWNSDVRATIVGMNRTTGKHEFVRAAVECIAYQVTDVVKAMSEDAGTKVCELRVDGGATKNSYLMQFQSDICESKILVPNSEELSAIGPAYLVGKTLGIWNDEIFHNLETTEYKTRLEKEVREAKYNGWMKAVDSLLKGSN